ncbi:MAG: DNA replication/repair protein RecF [bacterium]|nr:DNA replication/repair protein RecF [bacterium]
MILADLKITYLRNLSSLHLILNPRFNFIIGPNGSGKTSILEALYLLSCGHSFRSREIAPVISHEHHALTVFARAYDESTISIQKSATQPTHIKLNNQFCSTTSQIAYALPCQFFYSDIFQIIDAGASVRRSVLDWGLFHVKPNYLTLWKEYKKILKQRNALLKIKAPYAQFIPWDKQLASIAEQLDLLRTEYFCSWQEQFAKVLSQLTPNPCTINYYKGWDKKNSGKSLMEILQDTFDSDKHKSYTQNGAHQADIFIESKDFKAKNTLSRGQQKIILIALKLAQGQLISGDCLYLFDDLAAELDNEHQQNILNYLNAHKGQYVITNINPMNVSNQISSDFLREFNIHSGTLL